MLAWRRRTIAVLLAWRGLGPATPAAVNRLPTAAAAPQQQRALLTAADPSWQPSELCFLTDCTSPQIWWPTARALKRRVIAHLGPTNSGKTHSALEALRGARSGCYAGPLRLLASEVSEKLNRMGVPCHLITGQERKEVPGAQHSACTVEMVSTSRVVDVAVVDEIQLAADSSRGWSFTRALLGMPARELHVCGDPAMLGLLQRICAEAGDALEVRHYDRLSALRPARQALGSLDRLASGDCVVAFSRRAVHALRQEIEALGKHSAAVVYGALPPHSRRAQAALFNKPRNGISVLAASDAVGMGLNLRIKRVIFSTMRKYDGTDERPLTAPEIKQIAGRAGRHLQPGTCTTIEPEDLPLLHEGLAAPPKEYEAAAIQPPFHMLEAFASQHPRASLPQILQGFQERAFTSPNYFMSQAEEVQTLALMLAHLPLTLREAYLFSIAPCDPDDGPVAAAFLRFATAFVQRRRVSPLLAMVCCPSEPARSEAELQGLEAAHRVLDLYVWLAFRFSDAFEGREAVEQQRSVLAQLIDTSLQDMGLPPARRQRRKKALSTSLP